MTYTPDSLRSYAAPAAEDSRLAIAGVLRSHADAWEADIGLLNEKMDALMKALFVGEHKVAALRERLEEAERLNKTYREGLLDENGLVLKLQADNAALRESEGSAWGIIANAQDWNVPDDGTPCGNKSKAWREAAIRWRDKWVAALRERLEAADLWSPERLARKFHDLYCEYATQYNWRPQSGTMVPWEFLPVDNQRLMVAVSEGVLAALAGKESET